MLRLAHMQANKPRPGSLDEGDCFVWALLGRVKAGDGMANGTKRHTTVTKLMRPYGGLLARRWPCGDGGTIYDRAVTWHRVQVIMGY